MKVRLLHQLGLPVNEERRADVEVEVREAVSLSEVGVPQPDGGLNRKLPHQDVVHPPESKLKIDDFVGDEMLVKLLVDSLNQFFKLTDFELNAGLRKGVVVLNAGQDGGQAPVRVGLDPVPLRLVEKGLDVEVGRVEDVEALSGFAIGAAVLKEDEKEGCDQIVDALDVAGRWMPDRPDVKDSLEDLLNTPLLEKADDWTHSRDVDVDLAVGVLVDVLVPGEEVLFDAVEVLLLLPQHDFVLARSVSGQVAAQDLPGFGSRPRRDAGPGKFAKFFKFNCRALN